MFSRYHEKKKQSVGWSDWILVPLVIENYMQMVLLHRNLVHSRFANNTYIYRAVSKEHKKVTLTKHSIKKQKDVYFNLVNHKTIQYILTVYLSVDIFIRKIRTISL